VNDRLFEENLRALKRYLPKDLVKAFKRTKPARVRLTGKLEDGSLNAAINGAPLYQPDALTFAALQVEAFCKQPDRLFLPFTRYDSGKLLEFSHIRLPRRLLGEMQGVEIAQEPAGGGAYLISIGLGLGIHLPQLIERLDFRNLLIVESDSELIYWSMHVLPWARMIETLKQRGGGLTIGPAGDPVQTAGALIGSLRGPDFALVDGSYLYRHHRDPASDALAAAVRETFPILHGTVGFFEDECLMLKHAVENAAAVPHRQLLPGGRPDNAAPPAFVVGSGPSLDRSIEAIRRHVDKAVIFGAGTGTSALLKNGIKPQFHCEIENDPNYAGILTDDARVHDYSGITFLAPYIVDPRLPKLFDKSIFYFRELLIPTRLMARPVDILHFSTPSVSNLACRAAAAMGHTEVYLFGVDLGSRQAAHQHASDSLYSRNEDWMALSPLNQPVPANFGGQAVTNKQFLAARTTFQQFFADWTEGTVLNCSDGIAIHGAVPRKSEALSLSPPSLPPADYAEAVETALPWRAAGALSSGGAVPKYLAGVGRQFEAIAAILADAPRTADQPHPVTGLHDRLLPLLLGGHLDSSHTVEAAVRTTFTGTIIAALQFGRFFEMRMDPDQKSRFFTQFVEALNAELATLKSQFDDMFTSL